MLLGASGLIRAAAAALGADSPPVSGVLIAAAAIAAAVAVPVARAIHRNRSV